MTQIRDLSIYLPIFLSIYVHICPERPTAEHEAGIDDLSVGRARVSSALCSPDDNERHQELMFVICLRFYRTGGRRLVDCQELIVNISGCEVKTRGRSRLSLAMYVDRALPPPPFQDTFDRSTTHNGRREGASLRGREFTLRTDRW